MVKKHVSTFSSLCFSKAITWPPRETIEGVFLKGSRWRSCQPGGLFLHCDSLFVTRRSQARVARILFVVELLWVSVEAEYVRPFWSPASSSAHLSLSAVVLGCVLAVELLPA